MIDPASLLVDRRARRAKTDRLDAEALLRALMALCRGEPRVCVVVRAPSVEEEDARRTTRERANLLKERVRHVNRIKGLLATQGMYDFEPLRPDRLERLGALVTGDGRTLPERLAAEVRRHLRRLELVLEMLGEVEAERDRARPRPGKAALLRASRGSARKGRRCCAPSSSTARSRTGAAWRPTPAWRRARSRAATAAASRGSARPATRASPHDGRAGLAVDAPPAGERARRWFTARVGAAKGRVRRIAIVALARKLLVALWRYVETGLVPTGAVLKA